MLWEPCWLQLCALDKQPSLEEIRDTLGKQQLEFRWIHRNRSHCFQKSTTVMELEGQADTPDGWVTIQRNTTRLKKWDDRNPMNFNEGKAKSYTGEE